ncbi:MAG: O-antigen ligase family protein [bacterium]|nr:O-antigen ligase family protein [bacterium]
MLNLQNDKNDHYFTTAISWLFSFLILFLPFVFSWLTDELFEFNKMIFVYIFAILISGIYIARMIYRRCFIWKKTPLNWPIALFLLSQIISTIFSLHPRTSWLGYYTRLNGGLFSTLAYIALFYAFINNMDKKARTNFLFATFFSGIFISLYAIGEHFGHSFSCLIIKGNFDVSCWVQDVQTRVFASFGQPNWLAAYNVGLIGLGTPIIIDNLKNWQKKSISKLHFWVITISVYLNFIALIFTKSRSGILAFFAGLILTLCLQILAWWKHQDFNRQNKIALSLAISGFIIPALIWGTQYTPSWKTLVEKISAQENLPANLQPLPEQLPKNLQGIDLKITDSADIRKIVWRGALDIWRAHPLFGTGVETFAYSYYNYRPNDHNWTSEWDFLYNKAHNEFLNLAANSGAFGIFTYLSIFIVFGILVLKYLWQKKNSPLLIGLSSSLVAISITNFFGFSTVTVQVLLFLFLALGVQILNKDDEQTINNKFFNKLSPTFAYCLLVIIIIFSLSKIWAYWSADFNYARCKSLSGKTDAATSLAYCQRAIELSNSHESLYLSDTADFYAQYALAIAKQDPQNSLINTLANESLRSSNLALKENPWHLNLYKTRFRTLNYLGNLDNNAWLIAEQSLATAQKLAPTDPKIAYFYALVQKNLGQVDLYEEWLNKALNLRPLYLEARLTAAQLAQTQKKYDLAKAHYQFILDYIDEENQVAKEEIAHLATFSAIID